MTFDPLRTGRMNRDRRDHAYDRALLGIATHGLPHPRIAPEHLPATLAPQPATLAQDARQADGAGEEPLPACRYCGAEPCDKGEQRWHAEAECIGGDDRFAEEAD